MTLELFLRRTYCRLFKLPARVFFWKRFKHAFRGKHSAFWVVDIDNTIAHTWAVLTPQYRKENAQLTISQLLMRVEPLNGMRQILAKKPADVKLIFLTARSYDVYWTTKKWLKQHGFWQPDSDLVLVDRMFLKAVFFKKIINQNKKLKTHNSKLPPLSMTSLFTTICRTVMSMAR